ncbi:hypothetical protein Q6D67_12210 [Haliea sp. E1-2-M8]|uniref:hypothetical protein n=1 Tax=Haliea sp. E1-2-M8 TaxID=3064706 RepID=UPI0027288A56|nr:hypothetical protein [Haliea sp. E1-2-M8]MDO8862465.1 hypothetical protein [Haliea sp. E1-2-M8]
MDLSEAEQHLKLWGSRYYRNRSNGLGYSRSPLARLISGTGSDDPLALDTVDNAVSALAKEEPLIHSVIVEKYGRGLAFTVIGERHPDEVTGKPRTRDTVARLADGGLGFVACWMTINR